MTVGSFGGSDIVPQFGFRPATTVGVEHRPQQDVFGADAFYDGPMTRAGEYARNWFERRSELIPEPYSWLFVVMIQSALVLTLIGSTLQRDQADLTAAGVAAVLALGQLALFVLVGVKFNPPVVALAWWASTAILLFATSTPIATDFAPLLLVLMVGCVASLTPPRWGAFAFASAVSLLVAASVTHHLDGVALYLGFVALGWLVGYQMRTQHQLLIKQQKMQADLAEHAAAVERRRIAREVHDVIAHSLSVTMLHVTGARRALQQDRDIDDAVGALERRRATGPSGDGRHPAHGRPARQPARPRLRTAEPGIADIPVLVDDFVSGRATRRFRTRRPTERVSAAVGLALYRITQESLANIAKHAPASKAGVVLHLLVSASAGALP